MKNRLFKSMLGAIFSILFLLFCSVGFAENIDPDDDGSQYAWGEDAGWLNLKPVGDGDPGVEVGDDKLTGYIWGENIGWISLSCINNDSCDTVNYGVANDGGTLWGYAWGENVGWINFPQDESGVKIDPNTGEFSGYAWGENIGWINFAPNGIPVKTSWSGAVDHDGDGYSPDVDCDDDDPSVNPGVTEVCDGIENNCNGQIDEDFTDTDSDGQADCVDSDDDNDGVVDGGDSDPSDPDVCEDSDGDGCDDCSVGADDFGPLADNDPNNDGLDTDGDGTCDAGDSDDDNDGVTDFVDLAPFDPDVCGDSDGDTCDDCAVGTDGFGPLADNTPVNDGLDTDADGRCDAGDPDRDGDGIHNAVDTQPDSPSNDFSDGTTIGSINERGDQLFTVVDAEDPADGLTITTEPAGGAVPTTVTLCGEPSQISLEPGDVVKVTCDNIIVEVVSGVVEIVFVANDGTTTATSLAAGNSLEYDPVTLTITAPETNTVPAVVVVDGKDISLAPGDQVRNMEMTLAKAKVGWHHQDLHLKGWLQLPQGVWPKTLSPFGNALISLAGDRVKDQEVQFDKAGKKGDKWRYKDKKNLYGYIKEFKIDWKDARFNYNADDKIDIQTLFIGPDETVMCINTKHISMPLTVTINGTTITYTAENTIETDLTYAHRQHGKDKDHCAPKHRQSKSPRHKKPKNDYRHVHFILPFPLTYASEMSLAINGAVNSIPVAAYFQKGYGQFKLTGNFDPELLPGGSQSSPVELKFAVSLGEGANMVFGSDQINDEKGWTKKTNKHWGYK